MCAFFDIGSLGFIIGSVRYGTHTMSAHNQPSTAAWASLEASSKYSGLGVRVLENAVKNGMVRSSLVRSFPTAKRGRRLIDLRSLDQWIEAGVGGKSELPYLVGGGNRRGVSQ